MSVEGANATFDQLRQGIQIPNGEQLIWIGNKRIGTIQVQKQVWTVSWNFTLDNYKQGLGGQQFTFTKPDGTTETVRCDNMTRAFLNSLTVAIPSTVIPILIAAFAAHAFAWMKFPGRKWIFILVVALLRDIFESAFIDGASPYPAHSPGLLS